MEAIARIPAPDTMFDYVRGLLWESGELGRSICRRGWSHPDVWAIATAGTSAERALLSISGGLVKSSANAWMDKWLVAQSKLAHNFCVVAQDMLALPMEADDASPIDAPGRWDVRGEECYFIVPKDELGEGIVDATANLMISDEFILYVIEDNWPFDHSRSLQDLADKVRHVLVHVSGGESYGVVSGA